MNQLGLIYTYYNSSELFRWQVKVWNNYPEYFKNQIAIYVIDDHSDKFPLQNEEFPKGIEFHAYWLDKRFNGQGGRNVGAFEASNKWLLFSDIDHIIPKKSLVDILARIPYLNELQVYSFQRITLDGAYYKPHGFSFLMTREMFWKIGGHDEQLSGLYYGTCWAYKQRLKKIAGEIQELGIPLLLLQSLAMAINGAKKVHDKQKELNQIRRMDLSHPIVLSHTYQEL